MCSTEEHSALLHRSREAGLVESGADIESVVVSVVREEGRERMWMTNRMCV